MTIINQSKLSKEVKEKYSVRNNAFLASKIKNAELDKYDGKPKDEINVIVGDDKQPDFLPQVKLCRWSNEVNFSVRLKDVDTINTAKVSTDKDKIIWEKGNIKIENYDYTEGEGGYKFVWYLREKPLTNRIEFTIQSKGLDFFYQPPMTEEHLEAGQTADETHIYDSEGNILAERPENVVGSYAVYHSTKGGMNDINGKDYKTGQAFFIYKSRLTDSEGKQTWAILKIENGIFSEEIPQEFLDKAVYPIRGNANFGYDTAGGTTTAVCTSAGTTHDRGSLFTSGTDIGDINSISFYGRDAGSSSVAQCRIRLHSDLSIISNSQTAVGYSGPFNMWKTFTYSTKPNLSISTAYVLVVYTNDVDIMIAYNAGDTNQGHYGSGAASHDNNKYSIYATYTPAASGPTKLKTWNGLSNTKIKTINGLAIAKVKTINGLT